MNRDYRDYPASIWDAIGDVDQGICCAALGGVVWDFMSHLTPAQLLAAMDSATLETQQGSLVVGGRELQVSELSIQTGEVKIAGKIESIQYADLKESPAGFFKRLVR